MIPRQLLSPFCCLQRPVCPLLLLLLLLCQQRTVCSPAYDFLACFFFCFFFFPLPFPLSVSVNFCYSNFTGLFSFLLVQSAHVFVVRICLFFIFIYFFWHVSCMGSLFLLISKFLEDNLIFFRISCCVYIPLCLVCSSLLWVGFVVFYYIVHTVQSTR